MENISAPFRLTALAAVIVALSACSSGGGDAPAEPPSDPPPTDIPSPGDVLPPPPPGGDGEPGPDPLPGDPPIDTEPPDLTPPADPPPNGGGGGGVLVPPPGNELPGPPDDGPKPPKDQGPELPGEEPGEEPEVENHAPVISGKPPTAVVYNTLYNFRPDASDADGDILHFSVKNAPPWASFDRSTGQLTGTPGAEHIGSSYDGIVISATDGAADAELEDFGIKVLAIGNGSVEVSWLAPTQNEDGSDLTNLAGFKIYWGTAPGAYDQSVTIENPGVLTYRIEGLAPAKYYFAATAFNTEGLESGYSNEVSKTLSET